MSPRLDSPDSPPDFRTGLPSGVAGEIFRGPLSPFRTMTSSLVCFAVRPGSGIRELMVDGGSMSADEHNCVVYRRWVDLYQSYCEHMEYPPVPDYIKNKIHARGGMEKMQKMVLGALNFFLGRFRQNAESARGELSNADVLLRDYPCRYSELEENRKVLVQSVDRKLVGELVEFRDGISHEIARVTYDNVHSHREYIEKIFRLRRDGRLAISGHFSDYTFYASGGAKEVMQTCDKLLALFDDRLDQKNWREVENERQREEIWFEGAKNGFQGLARADVIGARRCIKHILSDVSGNHQVSLSHGATVTVIRALLANEDFWREFKDTRTAILERVPYSRLDKHFPFEWILLVGDIFHAGSESISNEKLLAVIKRGIKETEESRRRWDPGESLWDIVEELEDKGYYWPHEWAENLRELELLPVLNFWESKPMAHKHVCERLGEVYSSYVFGNWLAVIALSRSLLEYAIINTHPLGGDACKKDGEWKSLRDLVEEASERHPDIRKAMEFIREDGNAVLHRTKAVSKEQSKDIARRCYRGIVGILNVLYPGPGQGGIRVMPPVATK